ncbi:response regulator [Clostridium sp. AM58-1XD]|uniref:response regulator n=1 Tax=Clostridium sp. AM58-1XD TaxID=2292307 RepID=UPI000E4C462A|nr:response regulator [Clostridium sp. AM58-1XD]RGY97500.1 response regulator [Clostridium sp. AM58-1XD]
MIHLLIADDDITILEGLSRFISENFPDTFHIHTAEHGIQALNIMKKTPVHILLSDIKMPMLDGIRLIELLKQAGYGCSTIILSGYDDYPLIRTALKSGACDYLLKPVNFSLLTKTLDELLSSMQSIPPVSADGLNAENFPASLLESSSSQPEFYDIPAAKNPFITINTLNDFLEKAQIYMINSDREHTIYTLNQFFTHLHPDLIAQEDIRDILSQFIYNLMRRNSSMIKIISDYKLTDLDVLSCIKNMPTLSQLQVHFIRIIGEYTEKLQALCEANENHIVNKAVLI